MKALWKLFCVLLGWPLISGIVLFSCTNQQSMTNISEFDLSSAGEKSYGGWILGDTADVNPSTRSGWVAMGGSTDVDAAFRWMIERSGGGDFVILRASGTPAYNSYIFNDLGGVNSVETLIIDSASKANDRKINKTIRNAEALFIAGGNQADYAEHWVGTELVYSVQWLSDTKKIPIGGTSSGCNVMGGIYFTARYGAISSEHALYDPSGRWVDLADRDLFRFPWLTNAIVDPHLNHPDRMGRLVTFLARAIDDHLVRDERDIFALGVDQRTAAAIDENGVARIFSQGDHGNLFGYAYFIRPNASPKRIDSDRTLHFYHRGKALTVYRVRGFVSGKNTFDLQNWKGQGGEEFDLAVDDGRLTQDIVPDFEPDKK